MKVRSCDVVGYARVSTEEQARDGHSLAAQRAIIEEYCQHNGLVMVHFVTDEGETGTTLDRPGLRRVFELMGVRRVRPPSPLEDALLPPTLAKRPRRRRTKEEKAADAAARLGLVCTKIDRLGRDAYDLMGLFKIDFFDRSRDGKDAGVHFVHDMVDTRTASGKFMLHTRLIMAEYERNVIAENTGRTLRKMIAAGKYVGRVPYGFKIGDGGGLEPEWTEQAVIDTMAAKRADGATYESLAGELNMLQEATPSGDGEWSARQVQRVLERAERLRHLTEVIRAEDLPQDLDDDTPPTAPPPPSTAPAPGSPSPQAA